MAQSFASRLLENGSIPLHLIQGTDPTGRACYYYIICANERLRALQSLESGIHRIEDFGEVIASGFGEYPDHNVKEMIKNKYGYDV